MTQAAHKVKVIDKGRPPLPQGSLWQSVSAARRDGYYAKNEDWLEL